MVENGRFRVGGLLALLACALALAGCGGGIPSLEPVLTSNADEDAVGRKMIGKPYKVGGKWYTPKEDADYDRTGLASWYGAEFNGAQTANGERFDKDSLTAAHPTLPLPSYVRVTVVKTGKSAVLRVNDRGPFHRGRIIDVSRAAADKLGFRPVGQAQVRVEYLGEAEVGGGDGETLVAEAKYGTKSSRSVRDYLPFGFGRKDEDDDDGEVEVRLAATESVVRRPVAADALPGVYVPQAYVAPQIDEPAGEAGGDGEASADEGAIDALINMKQPSLEVEPVVAPEVEALPEEVAEASQSRVVGAFDLFGAGGDEPAGAGTGELRAVVAPQ